MAEAGVLAIRIAMPMNVAHLQQKTVTLRCTQCAYPTSAATSGSTTKKGDTPTLSKVASSGLYMINSVNTVTHPELMTISLLR